MAIGNDNGGGVEYEVEPSSGGGGNLQQPTSNLLLMSMAAGIGAGACIFFGCWQGSGGGAVLVGFALLLVSLGMQLVAYRQLRRVDRGGDDGSQTQHTSLAASSSSGKVAIPGNGFTDAGVSFAGTGETVAFCHDADHGGGFLCRSVPIFDTGAEVRLKGSRSDGYWTVTTQKS